MSGSYVVETRYSYKYTTKDSVPINDIIDSLKSMERLIKRTPGFIEKRFDTVKITETQVFVERLESGSLNLDFIVKFICRTDDRTERAKLIMKEVMEENGLVRDIVAIGVGSMLTIGAYQILSPGTAAPSTTINAYQSVVFQAGETVGLDQEAMAAVIKKIPDQKSLGKDAFNVLKPAAQDKDAKIEVHHFEELNINRDIIDQLPDEYEAPQPSERVTSYDNVKVIIDASDRHNHDKGWAGSVDGVTEGRVKFKLDESLDPAKLHGRTNVLADISVVERYVPSKKKYDIKEVMLNDLKEERK